MMPRRDTQAPGSGSGQTFITTRNLTPHTVRIETESGSIELPPDGPAARLVLAPDHPDGSLDLDGVTVPLVRTAATDRITHLPDPSPGVLLIVARAIAEALPRRDDLAYPHDTIRNDQGQVTGCRHLGRPSRSLPQG